MLNKRSEEAHFLEQPFARATVPEHATNPVPVNSSWQFWCFDYKDISLVARRESIVNGENGLCRKGTLTLTLAEDQEVDGLSRPYQNILASILTTYEYIPTCDTAERSLFRSSELFVFKDPTKSRNPDQDCYVVARDCRFLDAHEHRDVLMKFNPCDQLARLDYNLDYKISTIIEGRWMPLEEVDIASAVQPANVLSNSTEVDQLPETLWMPREVPNLEGGSGHNSHLLAQFMFVLPKQGNRQQQLATIGQGISSGEWFTVPTVDHQSLYRILAPFNIKLATSLKAISFDLVYGPCNECSLQKPTVMWVLQNNQLVPYEPPEEMARFETSLSQRRLAFEVQVQVNPRDTEKPDAYYPTGDQLVRVRYLYCPDVLAHQASGHLPNIDAALNIDMAAISLSADVQVHIAADLKYNFAAFRDSILPLSSKQSASLEPQAYHTQEGAYIGLLETPDGFSGKLSPLQVQSLRDWLDREYNPKAFPEREIEESLQSHLNVRLVGRAERHILCRGGVVADDVGYGKTVVSLALMQLQEKFDCGPSIEERKKKTSSCIHLKATLVIAPPHLLSQWASEARKFRRMGGKPDVVVIKEFKDLGRISSIDIEASKMIIVADKLFADDKYLMQLSKFAGRGPSPYSKDDGYKNKPPRGSPVTDRRHQEWYEDVLTELDHHMKRHLSASALEKLQRDQAFRDQVDEIRDRRASHENAKSEVRQQLNDATQLRLQWKTSRNKPKGGNAEDQQTTKEQPAKEGRTTDKRTNVQINPNKLFHRDVPLLEYYSFARVIYDEFSYDNFSAALFISKIRALSKWVLSATPPTRNLGTVCKTAALLGVHVVRPIEQRIGLPLITVGPPLSTHTNAEKVLSYGKLQSDQNVRERQERGHAFLKHFASSNPVDRAYFGSVKVEEMVIINQMTTAESVFYLFGQHILQNVGLDADMLPKDSRFFLPVANDRNGKNGLSMSGYYLTLAASCWPAESNDRLVEIVSKHGELLQEAQENLKKFFDKAIWLYRRIMKHCEERNDRSLNVARDFLVLAEDLVSGDVSRFGGVEAFQIIFETLFPGCSTLEDVERQIGQPIRVEEGDKLINQLHELRGSNWTDYYHVNNNDIGQMREIEVNTLLRDAKVPLPTSPEESYKSLRDYISTHCSNDDNSNNNVGHGGAPNHRNEYEGCTKPVLIGKCETRGIKVKASDKKGDLVDKLLKDDARTLDSECYIEGKFTTLDKQAYPTVAQVIRKRNSNFTKSHDDFINTTNALDSAISHTVKMMKQSKIVEILTRQGTASCRTCGSQSDLNLVCECGHLLCGKHLQGATRCGDSGDRGPQNTTPSKCPSLLKARTIALSKLGGEERRLTFDAAHDNMLPVVNPLRGGGGLSSKSAMIINAISSTPRDEGVLLFVQYPEHHEELRKALEAHSIRCATYPSQVVNSKNIGDNFKVLLLMLESSESAGTNLQFFANHIMFASPLAKDLQESYDAIMKQAKGRCVRYGQKKSVKVYHFVTENTIEVDILELRRKQHVLAAPGAAIGKFGDPTDFEEVYLLESYFNPDAPITDQDHDHNHDQDQDQDGDVIMGDVTANKEEDALGSSPTLSQERRVNSILSPHEVWKAMNERNWLTTVGMDY